MPRKGLSKTLRFEIFDRDNFTCRYCGESPPTVKLVLDHIIPVKEGGTNDRDNLATSCEPCNQGKGATPLGSSAPVGDARRRSQEHLEQLDLAELAIEAGKSRRALRQTICTEFCTITCTAEIQSRSLTQLVNLVNEFGPTLVYGWVDRAFSAVGYSEIRIMKYVSGCARNARVEPVDGT